MENRARVTKEVLCEEARFVLANVMAETHYGRKNRYEDIRRVCEGAVSVPFADYVGFLEVAGYLRHDRTTEGLEVTAEGEAVVNGSNLEPFTDQAVGYFRKLRQLRNAANAITQQSSVVSSDGARGTGEEGSAITTSAPRPGPTPTHAVTSGDTDLAVDRYEKLANLGSGGIGTVYRARQVALHREVAIKEIRELLGIFSDEQRNEIVRRFAEVVRAAAGLVHPNIVAIHDVDLYTEYPGVIEEFAPGGSLRRVIVDAEEIPPPAAIGCVLQTLHALRAAHARGVLHRALKPEQLLIDSTGNVKLSDFGFARIVERDHAIVRQIYVGMSSVAYMAPELYADPAAVAPQSDIYALGIVLYELLTRKLPGRRSPMPSQVVSGLPAGIDDIFDRMTRDAVQDRYATIDDVIEDFTQLDALESVFDPVRRTRGAGPLGAIRFPPGKDQPVAGTPISEDDRRGPAIRPHSVRRNRRP